MDLNNTSSRPPRKGRGALGCGCTVAILLLAIFFLYPLFNEGWDGLVDAPWAHAWNGRPTLTGTWTGEFTSPEGVQFAVLLDVRRAKLSDGRYYTEKKVGAHINGQAQWCDSKGRNASNITIAGNVPYLQSMGYRDHVDRVHIVLDYTDPPQGELLPHEFNGNWKTDTLTATARFAQADGKNLIATASDADLLNPITVDLKKGDQNTFDALCKTINGSSS